MDSASSASVIAGSAIFLTMTALPESEAATSLVLMLRLSKTRRIASTTAAPSMMAPSTMLSGGIGFAAEGRDLVALAGWLQLDRFDRARADVQADEGFRSAKHHVVLS